MIQVDHLSTTIIMIRQTYFIFVRFKFKILEDYLNEHEKNKNQS